MNINVNAQDNPFLLNNNNKFKSSIQSGTIVSGVITSQDSENTIIQFSKTAKIRVEGGKVEGNNGDKVSFEVVDNGSNKLILKQIKNINFADTLDVANNVKNANVQELYEKAGYASDSDKSNEDQTEDNTTEGQKIDLAIAQLKRNLRYSNSSNSKSVSSALALTGIDITKISLPTMDKIVSNSTKDMAIQDKSQDQLNNMQANYKNQGLSQEQINTKMKIANSLNNSGIAVTESNIGQISQFLSDISEVENSELDTTNILKNDMDITLKNLLSSKHSTPNSNSNPIPEELDEDIKTLLGGLNIELTKDNINTAKDFISNEIDVTNKNFETLNFLKNDLKNLDTQALVQKAIEQIKNGGQLSNINLTANAPASKSIDYPSIITNLSNVGSNTINYLNNNNIPTTISNLLNNMQDETNQQNQQSTISNFATKKQLIEIQLKMTSDVMYTLNKNNIDITTQPLLEALNSIKQAENEVYSSTLTQMNAEASDKNINTLSQTFDAINNIKSTLTVVAQEANTTQLQSIYSKISSVTNYIPELFSSDNPVTLENISTNFNKMAQLYDEAIANPNIKFADNFSKVAEQVAPLLESLGINPTDNKIKAGSVLVRNNIDVTEKNVKDVETINLKIENLLENLTPYIASNMLSEGLNPLTENIDNILDYVETFKDEKGSNSGDNLAKELIKMEKDKNIDEETLKGIKAIYRALNTINQYGLSSVGSYLNTERDLTINSLLDSAKTFSQNRGHNNILNKSIDDTSTISENFTVGKSIKELISQSVSSERTYESEQILRFMENADYDGLKTLIQENPNFYNELLETVTEQLINIKQNQNTQSQENIEFLQQVIDEVLNANPETVSELAKSNLTVNKKNLDTLNKIKENKSYATKTLQQLIEDENIDISEISSEFNEELLQNSNTTLSDILRNSDIDIKSLQLYGEVANIVNVQNSLNKSSELAYKSYPIKLPHSDEITNLQMYILDDDITNKEKINIAFSLHLSNLGEVNATAKYNSINQTLDINMVCENEEYAEIMQNNINELINNFESFDDNNIKVNIS